MTPIIIPVNNETDECPSCGKEENKIEICKHCGYEYKEEPISLIGSILVLLIIFVIAWVAVVVLSWLFANYDNESLLEIIKSHYCWVKSLKVT